VAEGGDPIGVEFDEGKALVSVVGGNYIVASETDLDGLPMVGRLRAGGDDST
jgi:hypothetical protein